MEATILQDIKALADHVWRNPGDRTAFLVLADAFEESGQPAKARLCRDFGGDGYLIPCPPSVKDHLSLCEEGRWSDLGAPDTEEVIDFGQTDGERGYLTTQIMDREKPRSAGRKSVIVLRCSQDIGELLYALTTGTAYCNLEDQRHIERGLRRLEEELERLNRILTGPR